MEKRMNDRWEIIGAIKTDEVDGHIFEVVMGYRKTRFGDEYVTWECTDYKNYYWGHYYDSRENALEDLYVRAKRG